MMNKNDPLVSIVIPVYNGSNYLREAIDSSLMQTYANTEIIVVNDGSNDGGGTEGIALSYGNKLRYYAKENGGVATALNYAIERMKGEYFSWLSHDDISLPDRIESQLKALRARGDMTALVFSDYIVLEQESGTRTRGHCNWRYSNEELENSVFAVMRNAINSITPLIHRSHFARVGLFDETLRTTQDYDFLFRAMRGQKNAYDPNPAILWRAHAESGMKTIAEHRGNVEDLTIGFLEELREDEMTELFGSPYALYFDILQRFKDMPKLAAYAREHLFEAEVPEGLLDRIGTLFDELLVQKGGGVRDLYVFCAGFYGQLICDEFLWRCIPVKAFVDNNAALWGHTVEGTPCIAPADADREAGLFVVANKQPDGLIQSLKENGFRHVISWKDVDEKMKRVPPARWTTLEGVSAEGMASEKQVHRETMADLYKRLRAHRGR